MPAASLPTGLHWPCNAAIMRQKSTVNNWGRIMLELRVAVSDVFRCAFHNIARTGLRRVCLLPFFLFLSFDLAAHGEHDAPVAPGRVLGEISFPTSATSPEAQAAFIRGMLLLHLFEYPFAREEFIHAQQIEPGFAMAYWGEAMTYNHPIWDEQDLEAGRAALAKLGTTAELRQAAAPTPREKAFLQSLDFLYGSGSKTQRDQLYMQAMESTAAQFPDDSEAQLFYALSLLGSKAGVRDVSTYMFAAAIAQSVFCANPKHPGAAHYLIHSVDDPEHAVLGLAAARALGEMAPDAGHSLHMTSHIFVALGMWDDVVKANEAAVKVQNEMRVEMGEQPRHWGHYNSWLLYGYLEQGRAGPALELLNAAHAEEQAEKKSPEDRQVLDPDDSVTGSVVQMWARYLIETRDWNGAAAQWQFHLGDAFDPNLTFTYIQSLRAAYSGQASLAASYLQQFQQLRTELEQAISLKPEPAPSDALYLQRLAVLEQEMKAGVENARGDYAAAAVFASEASRLEGEMAVAFGPPFVDWPSAEMLGELLLDDHKYAESAAAFELELSRARQRTRSLLGLVQAEKKLGNTAAAKFALQKLAVIWHGADDTIKALLGELAISDAEPGTEQEKNN